MNRQFAASNTPWESQVGYSRAVRCGPHVYVSGTTAIDSTGKLTGIGDAYVQTKQALVNIEHALAQVGATLADVVRTRMFVADIDSWEQVGRAHAEVFDDVRPATSMLEVSRLIDSNMLVEIEADAIVDENRA